MKFMNLKRFASVAMAGALALSLTAPAFATNSTNITGTYRAITLAVTVPTTGTAIINPYGLPYELSEGVSISGQQITTGAPLLIANRSAVSLSVSATAIGTVKGDFVYSATDPTTAGAGGASLTTKAGLVKVQVFPATGVTQANAEDADALNTKFAALPDDSPDPTKDIIVGTTAATVNDIITLKKANASDELVDGGAAFFRLTGKVVKSPATAWASTDGFAVKVAFTFEPTVMTASAGTIAATAVDGSAGELGPTSGIQDQSQVVNLTLGSGVPATLAWTWSSSDETKATVAVDGTDSKKATVSRVGAGSATITATATGDDGTVYSATIDFTIT